MKNKTLFAAAALVFAACGTQPDGGGAPASATKVEMGEEIALLMPDSVGGTTVNEALWLRRSSREYADVPLTLEELSGTVWAAAGINRPENGHRTAPSALALYPIHTYAFFREGVYRYDASAHRLVRVFEGDLRALSGAQPFVAKAPLNLVFIADREAYAGRGIPDGQMRCLCGQDAAGCAENVNLYAAGHGLKSVTRGSAPERLVETLGLDPARYFFALAVTVGR